jgi:hypothetical protein
MMVGTAWMIAIMYLNKARNMNMPSIVPYQVAYFISEAPLSSLTIRSYEDIEENVIPPKRLALIKSS